MGGGTNRSEPTSSSGELSRACCALQTLKTDGPHCPLVGLTTIRGITRSKPPATNLKLHCADKAASGTDQRMLCFLAG